MATCAPRFQYYGDWCESMSDQQVVNDEKGSSVVGTRARGAPRRGAAECVEALRLQPGWPQAVEMQKKIRFITESPGEG